MAESVLGRESDTAALEDLLESSNDAAVLGGAAQALVADVRRSLGLAARLADKAATLAPTDPIPLLVLGGVHLALGDPDQARLCYDRILEFDPANTDTLYTLGVVYHRAGMFERAADCFTKVIAARPTLIDPYYKLHSELAYLDRIPELIAIIERAMREYPTLQLADRLPNFHETQQRAIDAGMPCVLLNTMAKSGTVYLTRRLITGLGLAFSRIAVGTMMREWVIPSWAAQVAKGGALASQHMNASPENLAALKASGISRVVVHVRDPRQAMVSLGHHFTLGYREQELHWQKHSMSPYFPAFDTLPLDQQLRWTIEAYYPRYVQWVEDWARAADEPDHGLEVLLVTYEAFRQDEDGYLRRLLEFVGVDPARLLAQPNPSRRTAQFHYRKGLTDEWRSVCAADQQEWMSSLLRPALRDRFGWVP